TQGRSDTQKRTTQGKEETTRAVSQPAVPTQRGEQVSTTTRKAGAPRTTVTTARRRIPVGGVLGVRGRGRALSGLAEWGGLGGSQWCLGWSAWLQDQTAHRSGQRADVSRNSPHHHCGRNSDISRYQEDGLGGRAAGRSGGV